MSDATKAALDAAVAAHIADEAEGALVTKWALIAANTTIADYDEELTGYFVEYPDRQLYHVGLGLIHRHRLILESQGST